MKLGPQFHGNLVPYKCLDRRRPLPPVSFPRHPAFAFAIKPTRECSSGRISLLLLLCRRSPVHLRGSVSERQDVVPGHGPRLVAADPPAAGARGTRPKQPCPEDQRQRRRIVARKSHSREQSLRQDGPIGGSTTKRG